MKDEGRRTKDEGGEIRARAKAQSRREDDTVRWLGVSALWRESCFPIPAGLGQGNEGQGNEDTVTR